MIKNIFFPRVILILFLTLLVSTGALACSEDVDPVGSDADLSDVIESDAGDHDTEDPDGGDPDAEEDIEEDSGDGDPDADEPDADEPDADPDVELADLAIDTVNPARGPLTGNTPFTIEGEGFTQNSVVLFGITQVDVDLVGGNLTGATPPGESVGPVTVRVIDDETGEDFLNEGFTYVEALKLTSVQPSILSVEGGVEISLFGQGFSNDTRVTIGSRPVPSQTFLSSSHMRVIAPPNPAGATNIRLTDLNASYLAVDAVTYIAPVNLHSATPPVGTTSGGDVVVLTGTGFDDDIEVYFGDSEALVTDVSDDGGELTVTTPAHESGIVHITVETADDGAILPNGFAFVGEGGEAAALNGVFPSQGLTAGGEEVYLVGQFDTEATTEVFFGGASATVISVEDESILVETPAASAGSVDVSVEFDSNNLLLEDGFDYIDELMVTGITPSEGDASGGTTVTVTGSGFTNAESVNLGGINVAFEIIDDETITFTTTASSGGPADLIITSAGDQVEILEEAFFFTEALELWGHSPTRGAIAGNTYVEVRGQGFSPETEVFFGDAPAADVQILDPYTLAVRTPPHGSGSVEVTAIQDAEDALSPDLFTFFNPGAPSGGAWGNPIDGAVNVIVFSYQGSAVENAFVMLSTNANTPYTGVTDANGMLTLSGPDIIGEQTITATAAEHSSTTVQRVNAENVTIFLHSQEQGDGFFPPPPPTATYTGNIDGLDKINRPDPDEILMAIVTSTRTSLRDENNPNPGPANTVLEDGEYTVITRIGDLALVAIGGLYHTVNETFTPTRMGAARNLSAADGGVYTQDIDLNIPINSSITLKFNDSPLATPGPDTNQAILFLDLGLDGIFGPIEQFTTTAEITSLAPVAPLMEEIADASYTVIASAESPTGVPYSETVFRNIEHLSSMNTTAPMTSTINFTAPAQGGTPQNGLVTWELHGPVQPDLHYFYLENMNQEVVWEIFLPGNVTSFQFPDFPNLSGYEFEDLPIPYPGGTYYLVNIAISKEGVSGDNFSYDDLGLNSFSAYSINQLLIVL